MRKKIASFLLILCLLLAVAESTGKASCAASENRELSDTVSAASAYLLRSVTEPTVSSVGGEWTVFALAQSGNPARDFTEKYYKNLEKYLTDCGGVLSERKYTEYSRVILALTATEKNPQNAAGYNLLLPLGDYEGTIRQGINGAIWALIALDSGDYEFPQNSNTDAAASRERYVEYILSRQLTDGGFSISSASDTSDVDITAMALAALSRYTDSAQVSAAVDGAIKYLSEVQNENGGYESWGTENPESAAQVLIGITSVGISPHDIRFTKNGKTVIDSILSFKTSDGGFEHEHGSGTAIMPTEQSLCGLAAALRFENEEKGIFDMRRTNTTQKNLGAAELMWYIRTHSCIKNGRNVFLYNHIFGRSNLN